jgi:hypothetical protein
MNEDTNAFDANAPLTNADACLSGAIGLDCPGQGSLRIDNARCFREPFLVPVAEIAATNSTYQHAIHLGEIRSP